MVGREPWADEGFWWRWHVEVVEENGWRGRKPGFRRSLSIPRLASNRHILCLHPR